METLNICKLKLYCEIAWKIKVFLKLSPMASLVILEVQLIGALFQLYV